MSCLLMRRPNLDDLPAMPSLEEGYQLRLAQPGEAEAIAVLLQGAFDDTEWTVDKVRKELLDAKDVVKTFIVDYRGVSVATASLRISDEFPGSGYLHWVASHPAHRRKNLGLVVCLACMYAARERSCSSAVLETQEMRIPAIGLYKKLGFEPVYREPSDGERWLLVLSNLAAAINL